MGGVDPRPPLTRGVVVNLTFLGGAERVTGSCHLIEMGSKRVLVDCGVRQDEDLDEVNLPFDGEVDYCILTHAHLDHSGLVPMLVKRKKLRKNIVSTIATKMVARIILEDFASLYYRKYGKVLYSGEDLDNVFNRWITYDYGIPIRLTRSISVRFYDAAHIIGSASVHVVYHNEYDVFFSGDIGTRNLMLMDYPPKRPPAVSHLVLESTYGDRDHVSNVDEAVDFIRRTLSNGGRVLVPAFSVGRAQEVIYLLNKQGVDAEIYLDSPMANRVTELSDALSPFLKQVGDLKENLFDGYIPVAHASESEKLAKSKDPCVIISASGMMTGGRVIRHLNSIKDDEKSAIVFVGYQATGTRGRRILNGDEPVKCRVFQATGLSAHADRSELVNYAASFNPKPLEVFLVHGEEKQRKSLHADLTELGLNVILPKEGRVYEVARSKGSLPTADSTCNPTGGISLREFEEKAVDLFRSGVLSMHKVSQLADMLTMGRRTALSWLNNAYRKGRLTGLVETGRERQREVYDLLRSAAVSLSPEDIKSVYSRMKEEKFKSD